MKRLTVTAIVVFLICAAGSMNAQLLKGKLSAPKKPTIIYDRVDVKKVTIEKTEIEFVFIVDNPNTFGIDDVLADYELFLKGNSTATGKDVKFTIPPGGKSELRLPLEINYANVFHSAAELTKAVLGGAKTIPFKLDITFKIDLKVLKFEIPLSVEGELPLPEISVTPSAPKIDKKIKF